MVHPAEVEHGDGRLLEIRTPSERAPETEDPPEKPAGAVPVALVPVPPRVVGRRTGRREGRGVPAAGAQRRRWMARGGAVSVHPGRGGLGPRLWGFGPGPRLWDGA